MPGIYSSGQEPQQINDEAEEWVTIIDPNTGQRKRVRRGDYGLNEVRPGATAAQPKQRPLNEA